MKITNFNKGIISSSFGSFWWGVLGTYYFQYITFVGTFEVVVHRCIWTTLILLITTTIFNKWFLFKKVFLNKKKVLILLYRVVSKKKIPPNIWPILAET